MGKHELFTEPIEHSHSVIAVPQLDSRHVQNGSNVATKALRRRVLQMIRDVGDAETAILEEVRSPYQARHRQVTLRGWQFGSEEAAHQCARQNSQALREPANGTDGGWAEKQHLKESPAVRRRAVEILRQLAQREPLDRVATLVGESPTQLPPSRRIAHINQATYSARAEREERLWGSRPELTQECERRYPGKLANHRGHWFARRELAVADTQHDGCRSSLTYVTHDIVDRISVNRAIEALARGIDTNALGGSEDGSDVRDGVGRDRRRQGRLRR